MHTSTRNFPNRLSKNFFIKLHSTSVAAICPKLSRIPTKVEYFADIGVINQNGSKIYK